MVILNKSDYITKMNLILNDASKFQLIGPVDTNDNTAKIEAKIQRRLLQLSNGGECTNLFTREFAQLVHLGPDFMACQKCTKKKSLFDQFYLWLTHRNTLWQNIWQLLLIRFYIFTQTIA